MDWSEVEEAENAVRKTFLPSIFLLAVFCLYFFYLFLLFLFLPQIKRNGQVLCVCVWCVCVWGGVTSYILYGTDVPLE